jgi:NTE family protein
MTKVGLVLGGGGIVGMAYHGAVLAGLEDATGWDPRDAEVVVGTSAGAASGAELRAGIPAGDMAARRTGAPFSAEGEQRLRALGPPPQTQPETVAVDEDRARAAFRRVLWRATVAPGTVPPGVVVSLAMSPGTLSAAWLTALVEWLNGGTGWPDRAFWPCAVDADSGTRVVFGRADAPPAAPGEAVAASCAIPGVNAPVPIGDRLYLDGGGWSPTNADVLAGLGLDLAIVLSPMSAQPGSADRDGDARIRAACRALLEAEVAVLQAEGTSVVVIEPDAGDLGVMGRIIGIDVLDEGRCDAVVRRVRASTIRQVREGRHPELDALGPHGAMPAAVA